MADDQGGRIARVEALLVVDGVSHRYGEVAALEDVSLDVAPGEFLTLLGPSGCGKTTLLRVVAGFLTPTSGRVLLGGRDLTRTAAHKRPVNMVFQRPALLPHLDVFGNVAFGPRLARIPKHEVAQRVADTLALVRLQGLERRRPHELSGGQMQRVALARALVNRPQVLLLDEPLAALDLKIRLELEGELRRIHRETGTTFVYVTHDQREALAVSDRVAILNAGHVEQIGPPAAVYREPSTPFAASFVGDSNVLEAQLVVDAGRTKALIAGREVPCVCDGRDGGDVWLIVRPESVAFAGRGEGLEGTVVDVAFRGAATSYQVRVDGLAQPLKAEVPAQRETEHDVGDRVALSWRPEAAMLLSRRA